MSQRYERVGSSLSRGLIAATAIRSLDSILTFYQVSANDDETPTSPQIPNSPPPSFRSRTSSPSSRHNTEVDQNLADTFDADGSDSDEDNDGDDRQRLMRGTPSSSLTEQVDTQTTTTSETSRPPVVERRVTHIPAFVPVPATGGRVYGGGSGSDGVFANLSAKPERGEKVEEHPPVSHLCHIPVCEMLTNHIRHTNKPQQTPHHHTGRQRFWHQDLEEQMKFTWKVCQSALYSPLCGTA